MLMRTTENINQIMNFEIVAATYEEFLLGYTFNSNEGTLAQSFASHDHSSSIRSLAVSGHYLASGAADDRIIIYDLKFRKEHCMLTHHNSTITALDFTDNHSHLMSGSADGVLAITRVGNWQLEKIWDKAHKGMPILDIAVHSSGKLALTLGEDTSLRTWNLVKGRQAYAINLNSKSKDPKRLSKIVWADDGIRFILYGGKFTEIWSIETGGIVNVIEHNERISSCMWFSSKELLVGYEDGQLALVKIASPTTITNQRAHSSRVKAITKFNNWVITASSDGEIKVWDKDLIKVASINTGCRITCLRIVPYFEIKKEKEIDSVQEMNEVFEKKIKKSTIIVEIEESDDDSNLGKKIDNKGKKRRKLDVSVKNDSTQMNARKKKKENTIDKTEATNLKKRRQEINLHESVIDYSTLTEVKPNKKRKKNKF